MQREMKDILAQVYHACACMGIHDPMVHDCEDLPAIAGWIVLISTHNAATGRRLPIEVCVIERSDRADGSCQVTMRPIDAERWHEMVGAGGGPRGVRPIADPMPRMPPLPDEDESDDGQAVEGAA